MWADAQSRLFAVSCNHLQASTSNAVALPCMLGTPHFLYLSAPFDNRQACQIIAAFAVAINGFDALSCDAHVYALKALVALLTPHACSAS